MPIPGHIRIPVATAAIVVGVLGLFASFIWLSVSWGHFINEGPRLTLPGDEVVLDVRPDADCVIYQEMTGAHLTANNPYVRFPDDHAIEVIDDETGAVIESAAIRWRMRISFFGLRDEREAVAQFTAPPSGRIRLAMNNAPDGQVVYVGLSDQIYRSETLIKIQIASLAGLVLVLLGVGLVLFHLTRRSTISLDRPNTDAA